MSNTQYVINYLKGTCKALYEALDAFDIEEDDIDLNELDNEIQCCSQCGWWVDSSQLIEADESVCTDCEDEYNKD